MKKKVTYDFINPISQYLNSKIKVFNPENKWIKLWEILFLLNLMTYSIYLPIKIGFNLRNSTEYFEYYYYIDLIPCLFFIFDLYIRFNTAFFLNGNVISDKYKIFKNYLNKNFLFDIIAIIFIIINFFYDLRQFELICTLKILTLFTQKKKN